jgi:hypothetical protein
MPASAIGELPCRQLPGWPYSDRTLRTKVAELRPAYLPPDPASRTSYAAGELAQDTSGSRTSGCSWGAGRYGRPGS